MGLLRSVSFDKVVQIRIKGISLKPLHYRQIVYGAKLGSCPRCNGGEFWAPGTKLQGDAMSCLLNIAANAVSLCSIPSERAFRLSKI